MRVLHIISSLATGGAQKLLHDIALFQKRQGIEVDILVYRRCNPELEIPLEKAGVRIFSLDTKYFYSFFLAKKIREYIDGYDIIHAHLFPTLYQLAYAADKGDRRLVYTEHSTFNRRRSIPPARRLERSIYKKYSRVISISKAVHDNLLRWLREEHSEKFPVIENGIDISSFKNIAGTSDTAQLFGREGIPLLMISRFTEAKDQRTVIQAISLIDNSDIFVAFAGEGPTLKDNVRLAEELGVTDRCVFLGTRHDIPRLITASRIGIQSSNWEGFGLTAVEFMAAGRPIVASDVDGLRQIVEGAGITFRTGDAKDLADKIVSLVSDSDLHKNVSGRCLKRAHDFDVSKSAGLYIEVYTKMLNGE